MSTAKPGLPPRGILNIEFSKDAFELLAKRITTHLDVDIYIHHKENGRARVNVRLIQVFPPDLHEIVTTGLHTETNYRDKMAMNGFVRALDEMQNHLSKKTWLLYGYTTGSVQRHICITILPGIMSSYAFKQEDEKKENFNPSLN